MAKDAIKAIKLGTIAVNTSQFLLRVVLRLRKDAPSLGVEVEVDVSKTLIESLNSDSFDLRICKRPREQDRHNLTVHALPKARAMRRRRT